MNAWQQAVAEMVTCRRCHLAATRQHVVVYRGGERPSILFVGEAPGAMEDETGRPFVGRSGHVLDAAISSLNLDEGTWGITNVFMCRPPGNRFDPVAARACRPWLERKLQVLSPQLLVTLGGQPLRALVPGSKPVMQAAGRLVEADGRKIFPMLHPAATMRRKAYAARWFGDLEKLRVTVQALPL